jgi:hypothetical protein
VDQDFRLLIYPSYDSEREMIAELILATETRFGMTSQIQRFNTRTVDNDSSVSQISRLEGHVTHSYLECLTTVSGHYWEDTQES